MNKKKQGRGLKRIQPTKKAPTVRLMLSETPVVGTPVSPIENKKFKAFFGRDRLIKLGAELLLFSIRMWIRLQGMDDDSLL